MLNGKGDAIKMFVLVGLVAGLLFMVVTGWRPFTGDSEPVVAPEQTTIPDFKPETSTADQLPGSDPAPTVTGTAVPSPLFTEVPVVPAPDNPAAGECVEPVAFNGWATTWRNWVHPDRPNIVVRVPFGVGWPVNEPGAAPGCTIPRGDDQTANVLVAAHSAAQVALIDQFHGEQIVYAAAATEGREARVSSWVPPEFPTEIVCQPVGWNQIESKTVLIVAVGIKCGDLPLWIMEIPMAYESGRWYGVYLSDGVFETYPVDEKKYGDTLFAFDEGAG